jgi:hypothetical protein
MSFTQEKMERFYAVRDDNNLQSVWSIYEVDNLNAVADIPKSVRYMVYSDYETGEDLPLIPVPRDATYFELWLAAEALIRVCGSWHMFIEGFRFEGNKMRLVTGS